jgi:hypothetical protein
MATQGSSSPCEGPDEVDEGVSLQYSIDGGTTWNDIAYFSPDGMEYPSNIWVGQSSSVSESYTSNFVTWANNCYDVPSGAVGSNTMFQWHQEQITDEFCDHWGIDNISICGSNTNYGSIAWYDENEQFISNDANITVSPETSTTYFTVIETSPYLSDTSYIDIIVNSLPEPDILQTINTLSTNYFETYQWYKNTLTISGANDYFYNANYSGNYFVEVVDTNGCVGYSDTIYVTITNVNEIDDNNTIKIYPNPAKDFITIENSDIILSKIEVLDLSGKIMLKQEDNSNKITIDISNLEKGTYFIKINDFKENIKFVKD